MKFTIFKRGGYNLGTIGSTGGEVSGAVFVSRNPVAGNEAANITYTTNLFTSIPVSSFTTGNIPGARLPEFGGDLVKSVASVETSIKPSTVVPGTYTKVTVNLKGITTTGANILEGDLPDLPWSKITSGKPTTIGAYGITNALSTAGGVMTGMLRLDVVTSDTSCLANKAFADNEGSSSGGVSVGGIVHKPTTFGSTGFLRCNGSAVSKTMYPALYAAIGDTYSSSIDPGAGKPWCQQYAFNDNNFPDLTGWTAGPSLAGARQGAQVAVIKNKIYLFGGANDSGSTKTVQMTTIDDDGNLSAWSVLPDLPFNFYRGQLVIANNNIYFIGDEGASYVYRAPINADGSYGTIVACTSLPFTLSRSQAIVTKNRIYLFGGVNTGSTEISTVYTVVINADGTLGTWETGNSLPNALALSTCVVAKNRVYMLGGNRGSSYYTEVYTATIDPNGIVGGWTLSGSLPRATYGALAIVTRNRLAFFTGNNASADVIYAPINPDGTLGAWTTGTNHYSTGIMYSQVAIVKNKIYTIGGYDSSNLARGAVYVRNFSGGSNDYSKYYDGTFITTSGDMFTLPNVISRLTGVYAYIKY